MQLFHLHARRRRAQGAVIVLCLGLGGLAFAFFQTQVLEKSAFALQSDMNRLRPVPLPAPRGTIFDREGRIVADNLPGYALALLPAPRDTVRSMLAELAPVLGLTPERIEALMGRQRQASNQPLIVSTDLTFEQVSALEEHRPLFPGLFIDVQPKRRYPAGSAVAHLVGYVAEISEVELAAPEFKDYTAGQVIGKAGLERQYEAVLGGTPGTRYVEVDAHGRIVGERVALRQLDPVPGRDIRLHLDLELQQWIERIFPDTMRGAIVALEPGTGHVLALFSNPSYDPNDFVGGIAADRWKKLNDDPAKPLLHRAVTGIYPPGSTFKLLTAMVALELGVLDPRDRMPIPCRGGMQYGNRYFRCWESLGHGSLDLEGAIQNSCNVYFYQVGIRIGLERFLQEATRLGFATRTGIDLPVERGGTFPDGPAWYRRRFQWDPTPSEVLSLAIGQGPNDQTPLKIAQLYAALAADGRAPVPRLAVLDSADALLAAERGINLNVSRESLKVLRDGLSRVVAPGGTAQLSQLEHWKILGKTGTSQNPHGKAHGWFVGMVGPKDGEPEIVVAMILEFGEHGSDAGQYVAKTADYYLRRKYGMPVDTIQTLREHLRAGRPAPWAQWR